MEHQYLKVSEYIFQREFENDNGIPNSLIQFASISNPVLYYEKYKKGYYYADFSRIFYAYLENVFFRKDLIELKTFFHKFRKSTINLRDNENKFTIPNLKIISKDSIDSLVVYIQILESQDKFETKLNYVYKLQKKAEDLFFFILSSMVISYLIDIYAVEEINEKKKNISKMIKKICKIDKKKNISNMLRKVLLMLMSLVLRININIYGYEDDNEFYKTNDIFEEERILNLYKDSDKKLRILWKYDVSFYINMDKINMNNEKENKLIQKNLIKLRKENKKKENTIVGWKRHVDKLLSVTENLSKGFLNLIEIPNEINLDDQNLIDYFDYKLIEQKLIQLSTNMNKSSDLDDTILERIENLSKKINDLKLNFKNLSQSISEDESQISLNNNNQEIFKDSENNIDNDDEDEDDDDEKSHQDNFDLHSNLDEDLDIKFLREEVVKITCPICMEAVTVDKIITFDCDDKGCIDCVRDYLLSRYEAGNWDFNIPCFSNCSKGYGLKHPDSTHVIKELIGQEKYEKMADKAAFDFANYRCANINCNVVFSLDENNNNPFFICTSCNTHTCLKCSEIRHDGTLCPSLVLKMKDALKNERMRICPKCFEVYIKDEKCEHVKCLKCRTEFCFTCSAVRSPTLVHGNHYHRPDCKYYSKYELNGVEKFDDVYSEKCSECVLNKNICKRPISMKEFYGGQGVKDLAVSIDKNEEEKKE